MKVNLATAPVLEPMILPEREPKRRRQSGIYQILCKPTGKVYVGSAVWIAKRKRHHREALLAGKHHSQYLQKAWNKYGPDAFEHSVLEYCEKGRLTEREQYYIDILRAADHSFGFNLQPKAHSNLGITYGPEVRANMSAAQKGRPCPLSPFQIDELRERMKGNKFRLGIKHTPECCERMSKLQKGKTKPWMTGRNHSNEFKRSVSERFKGKALAEEHKEKISLAHVGKKQSKDHRFHLALVTAKIKPDQFEQIKSEYIPGIVTMREIASRYDCCVQTVCNVIHGKRMVSA